MSIPGTVTNSHWPQTSRTIPQVLEYPHLKMQASLRISHGTASRGEILEVRRLIL